MKKDEILKTAKDKFNVKLDPKEKLSDLESKLETLEKNNAEKPKPTKKKVLAREILLPQKGNSARLCLGILYIEKNSGHSFTMKELSKRRES